MQLETKKYLYDIRSAADLLAGFIEGKSLADYQDDALLRAAVERQFEIIGEALAQLARSNEGAARQITDYRRIIAFRNILIHGYADVDDRLVWDVAQTSLPVLRREVSGMLTDNGARPTGRSRSRLQSRYRGLSAHRAEPAS